MCNLRRSDSLRERPGYEYGVEGPEDHVEPFVPPYFDSYGSPAGSYDVPESVPLFNDNDYSVQQPPVRVPILRPQEHQPQPVDPYAGRYICILLRQRQTGFHWQFVERLEHLYIINIIL